MTLRLLAPWCEALSYQQQAVLVGATRGCDDTSKDHGSKGIVVSIRGCCLMSALVGRELKPGEKAGTYMSQASIGPLTYGDQSRWRAVLRRWDDDVDSLPLHFFQHVSQAASILRQHPIDAYALAWTEFYERCCDFMHMRPETVEEMNERLNDFGREQWEGVEAQPAPDASRFAEGDDATHAAR